MSDDGSQEKNGLALVRAAAKGDDRSDNSDSDVSEDSDDGSQERNDLAMVRAADDGDARKMEELLSVGANVSTSWKGLTALTIAAEKGHLEVCKLLLSKGASVSKSEDGWSPLMVAAQEGHTEVCKLLLETGKANIEEITRKGNTALNLAASKGFARTVELLLSKGARVDSKDYQRYTALLLAAEKGHTEVCELLLANGSDPEERHSGHFQLWKVTTDDV